MKYLNVAEWAVGILTCLFKHADYGKKTKTHIAYCDKQIRQGF